MPGTRKPIVAGQFYEDGKDKLKEQLSSAFLDRKFGPGALPGKETGDSKLSAIVVPHAGYPFSAACAAFCYKELAELSKDSQPDTIIIFGTDHSGSGTCLCDQDFETPFGVKESDASFISMLHSKGIPINNKSHAKEHSIEVQIPFLQFIASKAKIVPLIVGQDWKDFDVTLSLAIKAYEKEGKKALILVSTDFTHYGFNYGFFPFKTDIKENMHRLDKGAIDLILKLDEHGFVEYMRKTKATICGAYGIALMLNIIKAKSKKTKLLKYYASGDIVNDYSSAVGYASISFE